MKFFQIKMAFATVPEERILTAIRKTWLYYFKNDPAFAGFHIVPYMPDIDTNFKLPALTMKVIKEDRDLTSLSGFHWNQEVSDTHSLWRLCGFTYVASYQFDLLTKQIWEMNKYVQIINQKLKAYDSSDVFASRGGPVQTVMPVLDFVSPTSAVPTVTDLKIRFRFRRDVEWIEVPAFDTELHQYSFTVSFWCHYLKEYEVPRIEIIEQTITQI